MAFTMDDVASLDAVIASGELTWRYKDRQVTYQSTDAMIKARQMMLDEINAAAGTQRRRMYRLSQSGTGYGC
jgi:hypothetical protein